MDEEVPGAQRGAGSPVAAIGALRGCPHSDRLRTAERLAQGMAGDAEAVGEPQQCFARPRRHGNHIAQRQGAARLFGRWRRAHFRDEWLMPFGQCQNRRFRHPLHQRIGPATSRGA